MFSAVASPLANDVPTRREPISPGPAVKAIPSKSVFSIPARFIASETTGTMFCWCALDASSGTTPPYASWTLWLAITLERSIPSLITAADVSSHDDSMPKIMLIILCLYALQR